MTTWPEANLDPIGRARVLAASVPSSATIEGVLDAPYERVWPWLTDLENSIHRFDSSVSRIRVRERVETDDAVDLAMVVTARGVRLPFRARIEEGFCMMSARARLYLVVLAAVPEDGGRRTRYLHLEAVPLPMTWGLRHLLQIEVNHDFANLTRIARTELAD